MSLLGSSGTAADTGNDAGNDAGNDTGNSDGISGGRCGFVQHTPYVCRPSLLKYAHES